MKKLSLNTQIIAGALAGVGLAFWCGPVLDSLGFESFTLWNDAIKATGSLFVASLKMILIPILFSSVVLGIVALKDHPEKGKIGATTAVFFLVTTAIAVLVGLLFANIFRPGYGESHLLGGAVAPVVSQMTAGEILGGMLNGLFLNPFAALASGTDAMLAIIFFSIVLGLALISLPSEKGNALRKVIEDGFDVTQVITSWIMKLAPIGVFALLYSMITQVGANGGALLLSLGKFVSVVVIATALHGFVLLPLTLKLLTGRSPLKFFREFKEALLTAYATSSSAATLPVSFRCVEQNMGISRKISGCVLPLGCTVNMNGTALYEGMVALFVAGLYGIELTMMQQAIVFFMAMIAAIGAPGIPSAGMVTVIMVLTSVGLPTEPIALLLSVDRFLDAFRTMVNVEGDGIGCVVVDHYFGDSKA